MSNVEIKSRVDIYEASGNFSVTEQVRFILKSERYLNDQSDHRVPPILIPANTEIVITQREHDRANVIGQPQYGRTTNYYCNLVWDGGEAQIGDEWGYSHVKINDVLSILAR